MKTCRECLVEKPLSEFRKNSRRADGVDNCCKTCFKIKDAEYRSANPERIKAIRRKWEDSHPGRITELSAVWYSVNSDKVKASSSVRYYGNREGALQRMKAYRLADTEAWSERIRRSRSLKPDLYAEHHRRKEHGRRARKRYSGGNLSIGLSERLYKLQRGQCPCCGQPLGGSYHMDHIVPLALGGANSDDNIQLLRKECNLSKGSKHPIAFMQSRGFLI